MDEFDKSFLKELMAFFVIISFLFIFLGFVIHLSITTYNENIIEWQALDKDELKEWISNNHGEPSHDEAVNKYIYGNFGGE